MVNSKAGILLLGDTHVEEDSIEELSDIFNEVFQIPAKVFIQLGDLCDKNVVNAEELKFLTQVMREAIDRFDEVGALVGNHDAKDNKVGITDYLTYLDIKMYPDEYYFGEKTSKYSSKFGALLLGHFFLDKSLSAFGHYRYTLEEIKKREDFHYCFLGHQHDFQELDKGIYHLGSARYVSFAEKEDVKKRAVWLHDGKIEFITLNTVIPIYNVTDVKVLETLPKKAKVRFIYTSFANLKQDLSIVNKLKSKFYHFKSIVKFDKLEDNKPITITKNYNEVIEKYINTVEDKEVKNLLIQEFNNNVHQ